MADIKDRAREYIAKHSEYSEVFGQTFVAVDTMTAMVDFAKQETKELQAQIEKMKCCGNCKHFKFVGESLKGNYQCLKDGDKGKYYRSCNNFEKWEI